MSSSLDQTPVIRKLRSDESDLYRNFLLKLDPEARRDRFCGGISDAYLSRHAERVLASGAILYGCFQDGRLCGVAELHVAAPGEPAEAAFAVCARPATSWHRDCAPRSRSCSRRAIVSHPVIRVACLRSNEAMQRLAEKADARLMPTFDEAAGEIHAPRPNALSWVREAFVDVFDTVIYTMRWPLKEAQTV